MEDSRIIEQFFARSETAISELDLKYGRLCHNLAGNILGNPLDAEECVNDAYLGVWNNIPPERPDSLKAYLCSIVRRISLKKYRYNTADKRNSNMTASLEELEGCLASSNDVEGSIEGKELTGLIEAFLSKQKHTDRVIFMRRYYFSESYADIAKATGISEKNISVRLTRIRSRLRECLKDQGYIV